jgi:hypothetical protein
VRRTARRGNRIIVTFGLVAGLTTLAAPVAIAASGGTVVAWGWSAFGVIDVPEGLSGVPAIAAGRLHSLALKDDGTVIG